MKYTKFRKNPQLLTLVNPGKPPKAKARKAKAKKTAKGVGKVAKRKVKRKRKGRRNPLTAKQKAALAKGRAKLARMRRNPNGKKAAAARKYNKALKPKAKRKPTTRKKSRADQSIKNLKGNRPKKRATRRSKPRVATRVKAKTAGYSHPGWYARGRVPAVKARWEWVDNPKRKRRKVKRRRKVGSKQTPAQRRASLRNLKKARSAQKRKGMRRNPKRRKTTRRRTVRRSASRKRTVRRASPKRGKTTRRRRRRSYRRNKGLKGILQSLKSMVKPAYSAGVGFFSARIIGNLAARSEMLPLSIRPYMPLASGILVALGAPMLHKKVAVVRKNFDKNAMVAGALVATVESIVTMVTTPEVHAFIAPPAGLSGTLDVYEAALAGRGMGAYAAGSAALHSALEADDMLGEYIEEPMGEYIEEPLGEYIEEPMGSLGEYIEEPLGSFEVEEAVAGWDDMDLSGLEVDEAFAGFAVEADEGLAADHLFADTGDGGVLGGGAAMTDAINMDRIVGRAVAADIASGVPATAAARKAYARAKAMGAPAGADLRAAVVSAVNRAYQAQGKVHDMPRAMGPSPAFLPDYTPAGVIPGNMPVDGAPGGVAPIGATPSVFLEPVPVADAAASQASGVFSRGIF
jgi:hypothetical protein